MTTAQSTPSSQPIRRLTPGLLLRALRAFSLPVSVLPVAVATAAVLPVSRWRWGVLIAAALGAGLLHAAGNLLNDFFDFRSGVDRRTDDDANRPGRFLVHRQLLPRDVLFEALTCLALTAALAAYLVWQCGWGLAWFGLAGAVGLYVYTGWPFHLKYRALGELNIFVVFGPLLVTGSAWAQTGLLEPAAMLLSVPIGLATTAILVGNNWRDRQEDAQAGIRTIGHFADGDVARVVYIVLVASATLGLAAMGAAGLGPRALLACPVTLVLLRKPISCLARNVRLPDIDARTAQFETALLVLALAVYVVASWR